MQGRAVQGLLGRVGGERVRRPQARRAYPLGAPAGIPGRASVFGVPYGDWRPDADMTHGHNVANDLPFKGQADGGPQC